eukprot:gnl/TRDRNA2_/TRDRNA2_177483_c1_seq2.p2 gnl/TRDRNA2_/TRDRNA2_177483_c1~~gnl/TRDRNA2_/TRDRNA2_177483_c1_seq2.p2  ORF type:complete len:123 (+),score=31.79 gnl/TRDRNA2_/TRDRNA2_177483_c1_seq2:1340-1708(+)
MMRLKYFNMQELANTAWALAILEKRDHEHLMHAIPQQATKVWDSSADVWQPFFDCADVFSVVKGRARDPVQVFVQKVYVPMDAGAGAVDMQRAGRPLPTASSLGSRPSPELNFFTAPTSGHS